MGNANGRRLSDCRTVTSRPPAPAQLCQLPRAHIGSRIRREGGDMWRGEEAHCEAARPHPRARPRTCPTRDASRLVARVAGALLLRVLLAREVRHRRRKYFCACHQNADCGTRQRPRVASARRAVSSSPPLGAGERSGGTGGVGRAARGVGGGRARGKIGNAGHGGGGGVGGGGEPPPKRRGRAERKRESRADPTKHHYGGTVDRRRSWE